ncbi:hypothetical protein HDV00_010024 [Rhizophlyctis rosea]|nr:hypothetical protein HDV00_010024 [Rhizophlyctis rosea]
MNRSVNSTPQSSPSLKRKAPASPHVPGMDAVLQEMKTKKLRPVSKSPPRKAINPKDPRFKQPEDPEKLFVKALQQKFATAAPGEESSTAQNLADWEQASSSGKKEAAAASTSTSPKIHDPVRRTLFRSEQVPIIPVAADS